MVVLEITIIQYSMNIHSLNKIFYIIWILKDATDIGSKHKNICLWNIKNNHQIL